MKGPCKDCKDRHPNCHSDCDAYINWKRLYWKVRKEEQIDEFIGYSSWLKDYKRRNKRGKKKFKEYR